MADPEWLFSSDKVGMYGLYPTSKILKSFVYRCYNNRYVHGISSDPTLVSNTGGFASGESSQDIYTGSTYTFGTSSTGTIDVVMTEPEASLINLTIPGGAILLFCVPIELAGDFSATFSGNVRFSYINSSGSIVDVLPMTSTNPLYFNSSPILVSNGLIQAVFTFPVKVPSTITIPSGSRFRLEINVNVTANDADGVSIIMGKYHDSHYGDNTYYGVWMRVPIQPQM